MSQSIASASVLEKETRDIRNPNQILHPDGSYNPFHNEVSKKRILESIENIRLGRNLIPKTMEELEAMEND